MNNLQNVNCLSCNAKHTAVAAVKQVSVPGAKNFVLGDEGASFWEALQRGDLAFQAFDELAGVVGIILRDKAPNLLDVALGGARDSNAEFSGPA